MSPSIPKPAGVEAALKSVAKRLKGVQKKINAMAAKDMKSGDYEAAQKWMEMGRTVTDFSERANAFGDEWKRLVKATRIMARADKTSPDAKSFVDGSPRTTPAWKFCTPALRLLVRRGGTATLDDILAGLEPILGDRLTELDRNISGSRRVPRWHGAVQTAYRQCQKEGWIEKQKRRDAMWKITAKGRLVATDGSGDDTILAAPGAN